MANPALTTLRAIADNTEGALQPHADVVPKVRAIGAKGEGALQAEQRDLLID